MFSSKDLEVTYIHLSAMQLCITFYCSEWKYKAMVYESICLYLHDTANSALLNIHSCL